MDELRMLTDRQGFFTRAEAADLGYDDRDVARAVRAGRWVRFRRGFYALADTWVGADEVERHRVRSRAVLRSIGDRVALSHVSAALEHGLPTWGLDLTRVHVTRLDGGPGRVEGDVVHHEGVCLGDDVACSADGLVTTPVRSAFEAGSRAGGGEVGLVLLDALLHQRLATEGEMDVQFKFMEHWPFMWSMHFPYRLADGLAESVGESRGRWLFRKHRIPAPVLQFEVIDGAGQVVGTSDWAWPEHGVLGEFDGRIKYGRLLKPGQKPEDAVFAEKRREDLMREASGYRMIRFIWLDLDRGAATADRLRRQLFRDAG